MAGVPRDPGAVHEAGVSNHQTRDAPHRLLCVPSRATWSVCVNLPSPPFPHRQVYHEIQARYTKRYTGDMHLTGIFNTSYREVPPTAVELMRHFEDLFLKRGWSRGQNLALTVLCVPNWLDSSTRARCTAPASATPPTARSPLLLELTEVPLLPRDVPSSTCVSVGSALGGLRNDPCAVEREGTNA